MRERVSLAAVQDTTLPVPRSGAVLQFVVRVPGVSAPLEALVVHPVVPTSRLLVYFLGFNIPLGPWESAKAALLAESFGASVLAVELPGQSRFGDPLPAPVRTDMLGGELERWTDLQLAYLDVALASAGLHPDELLVLGFSTGCSLAMAALGRLRTLAPVSAVTLVEPVGAIRRPLAVLALDNLRDGLRQPPTYRTNWPQRWVMDARRRQLREPWVRYWPQDFLGITRVLCQDHIARHLGEVDGIRFNLVRGERSNLCRPEGLVALEAGGADGLTVTVAGFGHPLWHSFPVVVPLTRLLGDPRGGS